MGHFWLCRDLGCPSFYHELHVLLSLWCLLLQPLVSTPTVAAKHVQGSAVIGHAFSINTRSSAVQGTRTPFSMFWTPPADCLQPGCIEMPPQQRCTTAT